MPRNAFAYGQAFAKYFGPSGHRLMDAVEIGNEPGKWKDPDYRTMFENMARGLRVGDPKLRIATCAADAGKGDDYSKALSCVQGLENFYDVNRGEELRCLRSSSQSSLGREPLIYPDRPPKLAVNVGDHGIRYEYRCG